MHAFQRYKSLVEDWPAFVAAVETPLPTTLWTNTLRTDPQRLVRWLAREEVSATPVGWLDGAFRLTTREIAPAKTVAHLAGLCHFQEEAAMTAVALLAPEPGERLLDLCSAPGNKALQMAVRIGDQGTVVAVDRHNQRLGLLIRAAERLGVSCCVTVTFDATSLPKAMGTFDRVLADVPCSCEGTSRKSPEVLAQVADRRDDDPGWLRLRRIQEAILRKAVQRCRPGGRIVYATCTYAPEENEAVVSAVLEQEPVTILPAVLPGLVTRPGVSTWQGERYHAGVELAMRVLPHDNDTGGFFVALLEKAA